MSDQAEQDIRDYCDHIEKLQGGGMAFGMSLRDYFAAKAMQGLATTFEGMALEAIEESIPVVAKISMAMADAMLVERAK